MLFYNGLAACFRTLVLVLLTLLPALPALAREAPRLADVDALLQSPSLDFQQIQKARSLCEELLAAAPNPAPPALVARLTRVIFIQGNLAPKSQQERYYREGLTWSERLVKEQPDQVAGHYWKALHLCGLADVGGSVQGFKLLPRIFEELKSAVAMDATYDQAGPHRVLGRIYFEAPGWPMSVGDNKKSLEHLKAAVRLAPDNSTNHLYLAEILLRLKESAQARQELERVLTATRHATQPQGLKEDQQEARKLLAKLESG